MVTDHMERIAKMVEQGVEEAFWIMWHSVENDRILREAESGPEWVGKEAS